MADPVHTDAGERLAGELARAGAMVEELAVKLCLDPVVFARHADSLQHFDHVTQIIGEIANIMRSRETWHDAVAAVRLDALRERLGSTVQ